jgi:branched-chain amino acid transport system substrate-binding protein
VPLSGVFAFAGIGIDAGIKDYLTILNDGGGIKGRKVRYIAEDTAYKVDQSMAVFKRITSQNKVSLYYADSTGFVKAVNPSSTDSAPSS